MGGVAYRELMLPRQYFTKPTFLSVCTQALESDWGWYYMDGQQMSYRHPHGTSKTKTEFTM